MGFHTFDPARADRLDDESRFRWCSAEELLTLLAPYEGAAVADLGSGTGFYTDVVAPHAETVYAVDVQPEMHERYEENGVPENVRLVAAEIANLPFADDSLDAAFSTMTYHEFSGPVAASELARVLRPGGRLLTVDWSRSGRGDAGPPRAERHDLDHAVAALTEASFTVDHAVAALTEASFTVDHAVARTETFVCRARR